MNKLHIHILSIFSFICLSCQQQTPKSQIEQTAVDFCEAFYNFNYPIAEEWSTPSSLSYLSFLASNIQPVSYTHLDVYKRQAKFLDRLNTNGKLTKTILYNLNPDVYKRQILC